MEKKTRRAVEQTPPNETYVLIPVQEKGKNKRNDLVVIDEDLGLRIYRKGKSKWYTIEYNVDGQQRRYALRTSDPRIARTKAMERAIALRGGELAPMRHRTPLVRDIVAKFLGDREREGRAKGTIDTYRGALNQFVEFLTEQGVLRMNRVIPDHIREFEQRLSQRGVRIPREQRKGKYSTKNGSTTVHMKVKLVKTVFKWAKNQKLIHDDPLTAYRLPKKGDCDSYAFTLAEVNALCKAAGPFFGTVFRFLALTGLRQGELIWLTKSDFDVVREVVQIRPKSFPEEGLEWCPKSKPRDVPLSPEALAIVKEQLAANPKSRWLFPAPQGHGVLDDRLRSCRLCSQIKIAKRLAGIKRGTVHSLRHMFVTTMADSGASAFQLRLLVGHADIETTLAYYHSDTRVLKAAVDNVDIGALLKQAEGRT